jgi:hypothetical protein
MKHGSRLSLRSVEVLTLGGALLALTVAWVSAISWLLSPPQLGLAEAPTQPELRISTESDKARSSGAHISAAEETRG